RRAGPGVVHARRVRVLGGRTHFEAAQVGGVRTRRPRRPPRAHGSLVPPFEPPRRTQGRPRAPAATRLGAAGTAATASPPPPARAPRWPPVAAPWCGGTCRA